MATTPASAHSFKSEFVLMLESRDWPDDDPRWVRLEHAMVLMSDQERCFADNELFQRGAEAVWRLVDFFDDTFDPGCSDLHGFASMSRDVGILDSCLHQLLEETAVPRDVLMAITETIPARMGQSREALDEFVEAAHVAQEAVTHLKSLLLDDVDRIVWETIEDLIAYTAGAMWEHHPHAGEFLQDFIDTGRDEGTR